MNARTKIISSVCVRLADICGRDPASLTLDSSIDDLKLDSLALPQVLMAFEEEFGIVLRENEVISLLTARRVNDYVQVLDAAIHRTSPGA